MAAWNAHFTVQIDLLRPKIGVSFYLLAVDSGACPTGPTLSATQ
jgi:hypothetical protein